MRTIQSTGTYTRKSTGEEISYDFSYDVLESISDLKDSEILALCNRMLKVDGNNTAREKAKSTNGDSTAKVLTPEQKEANKLERKASKELSNFLKGKGISLEELKGMIG